MHISKDEIANWETLNMAWQKAKAAMSEAEIELDMNVLRYISGHGARPLQSQIEQVDQLRHEEYEARGELDHFISELP